MASQFHDAAKKGYLDLLREATKRDCNKQDETGMTPTLWAAYNGNVEALRLIVSRGGDPNKADFQGHTALHFASLAGHRVVIEFLLSFGCNMWALNNEYRTAMQLAAENGKREVVEILDDHAGRQAATNKRVVQKAKEKAIKDADERVKRFEKMVKEHEKRMAKEAKREEKEGGKKFPKNANNNTTNGDPRLVGVARGRGDGDGTSMFDAPASDAGSKDGQDEIEDKKGDIRDSRFWIPNRNSGAWTSLPKEDGTEDIDDLIAGSVFDNGESSSTSSHSSNKPKNGPGRTAKPGDSISTVFRADQPMWTGVDIDLEDDVDAASSAIELFLTVNDLEDYIPVFFEEDIDMKALELLTDQDIVELKLPLGPRRKLNAAIAKRKDALKSPGPISDAAL